MVINIATNFLLQVAGGARGRCHVNRSIQQELTGVNRALADSSHGPGRGNRRRKKLAVVPHRLAVGQTASWPGVLDQEFRGQRSLPVIYQDLVRTVKM